MGDLTARNMARCEECGKLIKLDPEVRLCGPCARAAGKSAPAEAERTGPFADLRPENTCTRCKLRQCLPGSEFCLNCQVEIVSDLGDSARDLIVKMETLDVDAAPKLGTYQTYRAKRRSTPLSHINVVGGQPLKWWRPG